MKKTIRESFEAAMGRDWAGFYPNDKAPYIWRLVWNERIVNWLQAFIERNGDRVIVERRGRKK